MTYSSSRSRPPHRARQARSVVAGACALLILLAAGGCASAGHLAEYDFRGRTVGLVMLNAPRPELLTNDVLDVDLANPLHAALRVGADLVKEVEAARARPRLHEAGGTVDVAGRMRERVLHGVAGELRAIPVVDPEEMEFEVEVAIKRFGIDAEAWFEPAHFFVESEVVLREAATGRRIWKGKVTEREAIPPRVLRVASNGTDATRTAVVDVTNDVLTAAALSSLSAEQIAKTLEGLADFTSDKLLQKFRKGLEKSRG